MIEHPILFQGRLVRAYQAGRKNQTRRPITRVDAFAEYEGWTSGDRVVFIGMDGEEVIVKCPYGPQNPDGHALWVRETWAPLPEGCTDPEFDARVNGGYFRADFPDDPWIHKQLKWKPSIFMPRGFCRTLLPLRSIRVERLQSITPQDAVNEGLVRHQHDDGRSAYIEYEGANGDLYADPVLAFQSLWDSTYKKQSWEVDPWVFRIEWHPRQGISARHAQRTVTA